MCFIKQVLLVLLLFLTIQLNYGTRFGIGRNSRKNITTSYADYRNRYFELPWNSLMHKQITNAIKNYNKLQPSDYLDPGHSRYDYINLTNRKKRKSHSRTNSIPPNAKKINVMYLDPIVVNPLRAVRYFGDYNQRLVASRNNYGYKNIHSSMRDKMTEYYTRPIPNLRQPPQNLVYPKPRTIKQVLYLVEKNQKMEKKIRNLEKWIQTLNEQNNLSTRNRNSIVQNEYVRDLEKHVRNQEKHIQNLKKHIQTQEKPEEYISEKKKDPIVKTKQSRNSENQIRNHEIYNQTNLEKLQKERIVRDKEKFTYISERNVHDPPERVSNQEKHVPDAKNNIRNGENHVHDKEKHIRNKEECNRDKEKRVRDEEEQINDPDALLLNLEKNIDVLKKEIHDLRKYNHRSENQVENFKKNCHNPRHRIPKLEWQIQHYGNKTKNLEKHIQKSNIIEDARKLVENLQEHVEDTDKHFHNSAKHVKNLENHIQNPEYPAKHIQIPRNRVQNSQGCEKDLGVENSIPVEKIPDSQHRVNDSTQQKFVPTPATQNRNPNEKIRIQIKKNVKRIQSRRKKLQNPADHVQNLFKTIEKSPKQIENIFNEIQSAVMQIETPTRQITVPIGKQIKIPVKLVLDTLKLIRNPTEASSSLLQRNKKKSALFLQSFIEILKKFNDTWMDKRSEMKNQRELLKSAGDLKISNDIPIENVQTRGEDRKIPCRKISHEKQDPQSTNKGKKTVNRNTKAMDRYQKDSVEDSSASIRVETSKAAIQDPKMKNVKKSIKKLQKFNRNSIPTGSSENATVLIQSSKESIESPKWLTDRLSMLIQNLSVVLQTPNLPEQEPKHLPEIIKNFVMNSRISLEDLKTIVRNSKSLVDDPKMFIEESLKLFKKLNSKMLTISDSTAFAGKREIPDRILLGEKASFSNRNVTSDSDATTPNPKQPIRVLWKSNRNQRTFFRDSETSVRDMNREQQELIRNPDETNVSSPIDIRAIKQLRKYMKGIDYFTSATKNLQNLTKHLLELNALKIRRAIDEIKTVVKNKFTKMLNFGTNLKSFNDKKNSLTEDTKLSFLEKKYAEFIGRKEKNEPRKHEKLSSSQTFFNGIDYYFGNATKRIEANPRASLDGYDEKNAINNFAKVLEVFLDDFYQSGKIKNEHDTARQKFHDVESIIKTFHLFSEILKDVSQNDEGMPSGRTYPKSQEAVKLQDFFQFENYSKPEGGTRFRSENLSHENDAFPFQKPVRQRIYVKKNLIESKFDRISFGESSTADKVKSESLLPADAFNVPVKPVSSIDDDETDVKYDHDVLQALVEKIQKRLWKLWLEQSKEEKSDKRSTTISGPFDKHNPSEFVLKKRDKATARNSWNVKTPNDGKMERSNASTSAILHKDWHIDIKYPKNSWKIKIQIEHPLSLQNFRQTARKAKHPKNIKKDGNKTSYATNRHTKLKNHLNDEILSYSDLEKEAIKKEARKYLWSVRPWQKLDKNLERSGKIKKWRAKSRQSQKLNGRRQDDELWAEDVIKEARKYLWSVRPWQKLDRNPDENMEESEKINKPGKYLWRVKSRQKINKNKRRDDLWVEDVIKEARKYLWSVKPWQEKDTWNENRPRKRNKTKSVTDAADRKTDFSKQNKNGAAMDRKLIVEKKSWQNYLEPERSRDGDNAKTTNRAADGLKLAGNFSILLENDRRDEIIKEIINQVRNVEPRQIRGDDLSKNVNNLSGSYQDENEKAIRSRIRVRQNSKSKRVPKNCGDGETILAKKGAGRCTESRKETETNSRRSKPTVKSDYSGEGDMVLKLSRRDERAGKLRVSKGGNKSIESPGGIEMNTHEYQQLNDIIKRASDYLLNFNIRKDKDPWFTAKRSPKSKHSKENVENLKGYDRILINYIVKDAIKYLLNVTSKQDPNANSESKNDGKRKIKHPEMMGDVARETGNYVSIGGVDSWRNRQNAESNFARSVRKKPNGNTWVDEIMKEAKKYLWNVKRWQRKEIVKNPRHNKRNVKYRNSRRGEKEKIASFEENEIKKEARKYLWSVKPWQKKDKENVEKVYRRSSIDKRNVRKSDKNENEMFLKTDVSNGEAKHISSRELNEIVSEARKYLWSVKPWQKKDEDLRMNKRNAKYQNLRKSENKPKSNSNPRRKGNKMVLTQITLNNDKRIASYEMGKLIKEARKFLWSVKPGQKKDNDGEGEELIWQSRRKIISDDPYGNKIGKSMGAPTEKRWSYRNKKLSAREARNKKKFNKKYGLNENKKISNKDYFAPSTKSPYRKNDTVLSTFPSSGGSRTQPSFYEKSPHPSVKLNEENWISDALKDARKFLWSVKPGQKKDISIVENIKLETMPKKHEGRIKNVGGGNMKVPRLCSNQTRKCKMFNEMLFKSENKTNRKNKKNKIKKLPEVGAEENENGTRPLTIFFNDNNKIVSPINFWYFGNSKTELSSFRNGTAQNASVDGALLNSILMEIRRFLLNVESWQNRTGNQNGTDGGATYRVKVAEMLMEYLKLFKTNASLWPSEKLNEQIKLKVEKSLEGRRKKAERELLRKREEGKNEENLKEFEDFSERQEDAKEEHKLRELQKLNEQFESYEIKKINRMEELNEQLRLVDGEKSTEELKLDERVKLTELQKLNEQLKLYEQKKLKRLQELNERLKTDERQKLIEQKKLIDVLNERNKINEREKMNELQKLNEQLRFYEQKKVERLRTLNEHLKLDEQQKLNEHRIINKQRKLNEQQKLNEILKLINKKLQQLLEFKLSQISNGLGNGTYENSSARPTGDSSLKRNFSSVRSDLQPESNSTRPIDFSKRIHSSDLKYSSEWKWNGTSKQRTDDSSEDSGSAEPQNEASIDSAEQMHPGFGFRQNVSSDSAEPASSGSTKPNDSEEASNNSGEISYSRETNVSAEKFYWNPNNFKRFNFSVSRDLPLAADAFFSNRFPKLNRLVNTSIELMHKAFNDTIDGLRANSSANLITRRQRRSIDFQKAIWQKDFDIPPFGLSDPEPHLTTHDDDIITNVYYGITPKTKSKESSVNTRSDPEGRVQTTALPNYSTLPFFIGELMDNPKPQTAEFFARDIFGRDKKITDSDLVGTTENSTTTSTPKTHPTPSRGFLDGHLRFDNVENKTANSTNRPKSSALPFFIGELFDNDKKPSAEFFSGNIFERAKQTADADGNATEVMDVSPKSPFKISFQLQKDENLSLKTEDDVGKIDSASSEDEGSMKIIDKKEKKKSTTLSPIENSTKTTSGSNANESTGSFPNILPPNKHFGATVSNKSPDRIISINKNFDKPTSLIKSASSSAFPEKSSDSTLLPSKTFENSPFLNKFFDSALFPIDSVRHKSSPLEFAYGNSFPIESVHSTSPPLEFSRETSFPLEFVPDRVNVSNASTPHEATKNTSSLLDFLRKTSFESASSNNSTTTRPVDSFVRPASPSGFNFPLESPRNLSPFESFHNSSSPLDFFHGSKPLANSSRLTTPKSFDDLSTTPLDPPFNATSSFESFENSSNPIVSSNESLTPSDDSPSPLDVFYVSNSSTKSSVNFSSPIKTYNNKSYPSPGTKSSNVSVPFVAPDVVELSGTISGSPPPNGAHFSDKTTKISSPSTPFASTRDSVTSKLRNATSWISSFLSNTYSRSPDDSSRSSTVASPKTTVRSSKANVSRSEASSSTTTASASSANVTHPLKVTIATGTSTTSSSTTNFQRTKTTSPSTPKVLFPFQKKYLPSLPKRLLTSSKSKNRNDSLLSTAKTFSTLHASEKIKTLFGHTKTSSRSSKNNSPVATALRSGISKINGTSLNSSTFGISKKSNVSRFFHAPLFKEVSQTSILATPRRKDGDETQKIDTVPLPILKEQINDSSTASKLQTSSTTTTTTTTTETLKIFTTEESFLENPQILSLVKSENENPKITTVMKSSKNHKNSSKVSTESLKKIFRSSTKLLGENSTARTEENFNTTAVSTKNISDVTAKPPTNQFKHAPESFVETSTNATENGTTEPSFAKMYIAKKAQSIENSSTARDSSMENLKNATDASLKSSVISLKLKNKSLNETSTISAENSLKNRKMSADEPSTNSSEKISKIPIIIKHSTTEPNGSKVNVTTHTSEKSKKPTNGESETSAETLRGNSRTTQNYLEYDGHNSTDLTTSSIKSGLIPEILIGDLINEKFPGWVQRDTTNIETTETTVKNHVGPDYYKFLKGVSVPNFPGWITTIGGPLTTSTPAGSFETDVNVIKTFSSYTFEKYPGWVTETNTNAANTYTNTNTIYTTIPKKSEWSTTAIPEQSSESKTKTRKFSERSETFDPFNFTAKLPTKNTSTEIVTRETTKDFFPKTETPLRHLNSITESVSEVVRPETESLLKLTGKLNKIENDSRLVDDETNRVKKIENQTDFFSVRSTTRTSLENYLANGINQFGMNLESGGITKEINKKTPTDKRVENKFSSENITKATVDLKNFLGYGVTQYLATGSEFVSTEYKEPSGKQLGGKIGTGKNDSMTPGFVVKENITVSGYDDKENVTIPVFVDKESIKISGSDDKKKLNITKSESPIKKNDTKSELTDRVTVVMSTKENAVNLESTEKATTEVNVTKSEIKENASKLESTDKSNVAEPEFVNKANDTKPESENATEFESIDKANTAKRKFLTEINDAKAREENIARPGFVSDVNGAEPESSNKNNVAKQKLESDTKPGSSAEEPERKSTVENTTDKIDNNFTTTSKTSSTILSKKQKINDLRSMIRSLIDSSDDKKEKATDRNKTSALNLIQSVLDLIENLNVGDDRIQDLFSMSGINSQKENSKKINLDKVEEMVQNMAKAPAVSFAKSDAEDRTKNISLSEKNIDAHFPADIIERPEIPKQTNLNKEDGNSHSTPRTETKIPENDVKTATLSSSGLTKPEKAEDVRSTISVTTQNNTPPSSHVLLRSTNRTDGERIANTSPMSTAETIRVSTMNENIETSSSLPVTTIVAGTDKPFSITVPQRATTKDESLLLLNTITTIKLPENSSFFNVPQQPTTQVYSTKIEISSPPTTVATARTITNLNRSTNVDSSSTINVPQLPTTQEEIAKAETSPLTAVPIIELPKISNPTANSDDSSFTTVRQQSETLSGKAESSPMPTVSITASPVILNQITRVDDSSLTTTPRQTTTEVKTETTQQLLTRKDSENLESSLITTVSTVGLPKISYQIAGSENSSFTTIPQLPTTQVANENVETSPIMTTGRIVTTRRQSSITELAEGLNKTATSENSSIATVPFVESVKNFSQSSVTVFQQTSTPKDNEKLNSSSASTAGLLKNVNKIVSIDSSSITAAAQQPTAREMSGKVESFPITTVLTTELAKIQSIDDSTIPQQSATQETMRKVASSVVTTVSVSELPENLNKIATAAQQPTVREGTGKVQNSPITTVASIELLEILNQFTGIDNPSFATVPQQPEAQKNTEKTESSSATTEPPSFLEVPKILNQIARVDNLSFVTVPPRSEILERNRKADTSPTFTLPIVELLKNLNQIARIYNQQPITTGESRLIESSSLTAVLTEELPKTSTRIANIVPSSFVTVSQHPASFETDGKFKSSPMTTVPTTESSNVVPSSFVTVAQNPNGKVESSSTTSVPIVPLSSVLNQIININNSSFINFPQQPAVREERGKVSIVPNILNRIANIDNSSFVIVPRQSKSLKESGNFATPPITTVPTVEILTSLNSDLTTIPRQPTTTQKESKKVDDPPTTAVSTIESSQISNRIASIDNSSFIPVTQQPTTRVENSQTTAVPSSESPKNFSQIATNSNPPYVTHPQQFTTEKESEKIQTPTTTIDDSLTKPPVQLYVPEVHRNMSLKNNAKVITSFTAIEMPKNLNQIERIKTLFSVYVPRSESQKESDKIKNATSMLDTPVSKNLSDYRRIDTSFSIYVREYADNLDKKLFKNSTTTTREILEKANEIPASTESNGTIETMPEINESESSFGKFDVASTKSDAEKDLIKPTGATREIPEKSTERVNDSSKFLKTATYEDANIINISINALTNIFDKLKSSIFNDQEKMKNLVKKIISEISNTPQLPKDRNDVTKSPIDVRINAGVNLTFHNETVQTTSPIDSTYETTTVVNSVPVTASQKNLESRKSTNSIVGKTNRTIDHDVNPKDASPTVIGIAESTIRKPENPAQIIMEINSLLGKLASAYNFTQNQNSESSTIRANYSSTVEPTTVETFSFVYELNVRNESESSKSDAEEISTKSRNASTVKPDLPGSSIVDDETGAASLRTDNETVPTPSIYDETSVNSESERPSSKLDFETTSTESVSSSDDPVANDESDSGLIQTINFVQNSTAIDDASPADNLNSTNESDTDLNKLGFVVNSAITENENVDVGQPAMGEALDANDTEAAVNNYTVLPLGFNSDKLPSNDYAEDDIHKKLYTLFIKLVPLLRKFQKSLENNRTKNNRGQAPDRSSVTRLAFHDRQDRILDTVRRINSLLTELVSNATDISEDDRRVINLDSAENTFPSSSTASEAIGYSATDRPTRIPSLTGDFDKYYVVKPNVTESQFVDGLNKGADSSDNLSKTNRSEKLLPKFIYALSKLASKLDPHIFTNSTYNNDTLKSDPTIIELRKNLDSYTRDISKVIYALLIKLSPELSVQKLTRKIATINAINSFLVKIAKADENEKIEYLDGDSNKTEGRNERLNDVASSTSLEETSSVKKEADENEKFEYLDDDSHKTVPVALSMNLEEKNSVKNLEPKMLNAQDNVDTNAESSDHIQTMSVSSTQSSDRFGPVLQPNRSSDGIEISNRENVNKFSSVPFLNFVPGPHPTELYNAPTSTENKTVDDVYVRNESGLFPTESQLLWADAEGVIPVSKLIWETSKTDEFNSTDNSKRINDLLKKLVLLSSKLQGISDYHLMLNSTPILTIGKYKLPINLVVPALNINVIDMKPRTNGSVVADRGDTTLIEKVDKFESYLLIFEKKLESVTKEVENAIKLKHSEQRLSRTDFSEILTKLFTQWKQSMTNFSNVLTKFKNETLQRINNNSEINYALFDFMKHYKKNRHSNDLNMFKELLAKYMKLYLLKTHSTSYNRLEGIENAFERKQEAQSKNRIKVKISSQDDDDDDTVSNNGDIEDLK